MIFFIFNFIIVMFGSIKFEEKCKEKKIAKKKKRKKK